MIDPEKRPSGKLQISGNNQHDRMVMGLLRAVSDAVREAAYLEIPVICHIYPRRWDAEGKVSISYAPDDIALID